MNIYPHLDGRRAALDLRCSTSRQTGTSIFDQDKIGKAFCRANGLTIVKTFKQEGVTASVPGARTDFDDIIRHKREHDDFDVLVLTDISRFTRAGIKHGMNVEYELEREGIEVVFATTALPAGEDGDLVKPAYYFAAKMWIKTLAPAIARGMMSAFESGGMAHCNVPPHGLDFMYTIDGKPSHITRLLPDGRQLKLHVDAMGKKPKPKHILQTFPKNPKKAKSLHYRKQANEKIVLVPGDPDALATVVLIFTLFFKHDWGSRRIAVELNDRGIGAPRGGLWSAVSVDYILQNKVYLGTGMTNMKTRAVHAARNPISPKIRKHSPKVLAERRKHLPLEIRPRNEWHEKTYPLLLRLLDPDLRPLAAKYIERSLDRKAGIAANPQRRRRPRHPDSDYLLTGLLTSKQGGYTMGGYSTYARDKRYRLYSITKFRTSPIRDALLTRRIKADPLEAAVLRATSEIFAQAPDMTAALEKAIKAEQKTRSRDNRERSEMVIERDEIREEYQDLLGLGKHGREIARQKIQQCERRLEELESRIASADRHTGAAHKPADQARAIVAELAGVVRRLDKMPNALLKRLAAVLISRIEIDLETLEFELELTLPSWAIIDAMALKNTLRLEHGLHMQTGRETQQHDRRFVMGRFACTASGKPICFDCQRLRHAA